MKNSLNQFCIGLWLAMGVAFGIMGHSWESFWSFALIALFFGIGFWASAAKKSKAEAGLRSPVASLVTYAYVAALSTFVVAAILFTAERVYLSNADTYPAILASSDLGTTTEDGLFGLADKACERKHMSEIYRKAGDLAVIRCGMFWYQGKTYTASVTGGKS